MGSLTDIIVFTFWRIVNFIRDPFGFVEGRLRVKEYYTALSSDLNSMRTEHSKSFTEVLQDYKDFAKRQEEKAQFYCMSLENVGDVIPDMLWMKWADGTYAYANKSIRDNLLFDEDPLDKDDHYIGAQAINRFGAEQHSFGTYCAGSDDVVLEYGHRKRFIEYGMAGGKPLVLEVFKNVVRNKEKHIIATVGCGRDITDNIFTMFALDEARKGLNEDTVGDQIINSYLDKYLFENELIEETLRDFYRRTKDMIDA